jgi:hypothetical protein
MRTSAVRDRVLVRYARALAKAWSAEQGMADGTANDVVERLRGKKVGGRFEHAATAKATAAELALFEKMEKGGGAKTVQDLLGEWPDQETKLTRRTAQFITGLKRRDKEGDAPSQGEDEEESDDATGGEDGSGE